MDRENLRFLMGESIVLGEIKAEIPLQNENPLNHQIIWQQYIERIESLSPESKVSRFCMEAGFMRIVEVGQYFMTKDTGDFRQFRSVACREYTLPRDDRASQPKGWIQGNMRIGPVLEVTTSFQNYKYGIEIRIWSVGQHNSQSWVRISYGTIKYVIDSNQNNTEIPADSHEDHMPQNKYQGCCSQIKGKSKTTTERTCWYNSYHIDARERRWIDIEPSEQTLAAYDLSKKVHQSSSTQSNSTARKRWSNSNSTELNFIFEIILHKYSIGLMIVGKLVWQQEEVRKEDISIALIIREESFTSELFKDTLGII